MEGRKGEGEVEGVGNTGVVRSIRTSYRSIGAYVPSGESQRKIIAYNVGHNYISIEKCFAQNLEINYAVICFYLNATAQHD